MFRLGYQALSGVEDRSLRQFLLDESFREFKSGTLP